MSDSDKMLVAIMNNKRDFKIARDKHWYRIPVSSAEKFLSKSWPPEWLAFYQTKVFGENAYAINYYTRILDIQKANRSQLFPDLPSDKKKDRIYYQLFLEPLTQLPKPIYSRRWRRITFIPTIWKKFINAVEINDLYDESPLEDRLWAVLKHYKIQAERQELVKTNNRNYLLDFAIYCAKGSLNIETDGDKWHHNPQKASEDNIRNNDLVAAGWQILRFSGKQINGQMKNYCLPKIVEKIENLGGINMGDHLVHRIDLNLPGSTFQYSLFDT